LDFYFKIFVITINDKPRREIKDEI